MCNEDFDTTDDVILLKKYLRQNPEKNISIPYKGDNNESIISVHSDSSGNIFYSDGDSRRIILDNDDTILSTIVSVLKFLISDDNCYCTKWDKIVGTLNTTTDCILSNNYKIIYS